MSLKFFHIFFVTVSALLALYFGFWSLEAYYAGETVYLAYAVVSFMVAAGLVFYGKSVWSKLKGVGFFALLLPFLRLGAVEACATCYVDPTTPTSRALMASVLALLCFIAAVLAGFAALIYHFNKRAKHLSNSRG